MTTDRAKNNGHYIPLLTSQNNTWSETNASDEVAFDLGEDTQGPLNLGYLITRQSNLDQDPEQNSDQATSQRLAIIGDGDFLSNSYIGNASNLELGMALANWLVEDDALIAIPVKTTLDNSLTLTAMQSAFISIFFLIVLPLSLLIMGFTVWKIRRNR